MDSVSDYYSATQLRGDRWSALREATVSLNREPLGRKSSALKSRVAVLFNSLALIEPYWAFPGMAAFDHMRRQFEQCNFDDLSLTISRVNRALTTGAYAGARCQRNPWLPRRSGSARFHPRGTRRRAQNQTVQNCH